jgi:hypothetical protein
MNFCRQEHSCNNSKTTFTLEEKIAIFWHSDNNNLSMEMLRRRHPSFDCSVGTQLYQIPHTKQSQKDAVGIFLGPLSSEKLTLLMNCASIYRDKGLTDLNAVRWNIRGSMCSSPRWQLCRVRRYNLFGV